MIQSLEQSTPSLSSVQQKDYGNPQQQSQTHAKQASTPMIKDSLDMESIAHLIVAAKYYTKGEDERKIIFSYLMNSQTSGGFSSALRTLHVLCAL